MKSYSRRRFQQKGVLQRYEADQRLKAVNGETSEAVKVDQAARALTGMSNELSSGSSIRLCSFDLDSGSHDTETNRLINEAFPQPPCISKRCSTEKLMMVCKRQRQEPLTDIFDDAPAQTILCPVCLRGLEFLPVATDLREPIRNPTLVKAVMDHSTRFHPDEPLWNVLLNPHAESYNTQKIISINCNTKAAMALVDQSLEIAARSLDIPKDKDWASSWSRVIALILARLGCAHCYVTNLKLCHEAKREREIKRKARRYLVGLIGSVAETPPPDWWCDGDADPRRRNCVQVFFLGNHRLVGFIKSTFLPEIPMPAPMEAGASASFSTTMGQHLRIWQPPECVWTDPFFLDSECLDTQSIMNINRNTNAVVTLVAQCLAIAARSLPKPKRREWAGTWSRVKALTLARLGSAHRSANNANVATPIKREAQHYLVALVCSVETTPALHTWRTDMTDRLTICLFEDFFMDGANHRELGFIHPDHLPDDFRNVSSEASTYV
jgi:hypothetical protein